jgi:hypothetical protein
LSGSPNGWLLSSDLGFKDSDWVGRARYGPIAVLGPVPSRSHTGAFCLKDSKGRPLSGEHRYTITFDLKDLPPVTEFWEIPLDDRDGYFVDIARSSARRSETPSWVYVAVVGTAVTSTAGSRTGAFSAFPSCPSTCWS